MELDGVAVAEVEVAVVEGVIVGDVVVCELPHADTTIAVANTAALHTVLTTTTPQLPTTRYHRDDQLTRFRFPSGDERA